MRRFSVSHAKRLAASWVNGLRCLPFPITGVLGMLDSELVSICAGHTQSVETFSGHPVLSCSYNAYQHMEKRWCSDRVVHHSLNTFIICKTCTCRTHHYLSCIFPVQVTQPRSFRQQFYPLFGDALPSRTCDDMPSSTHCGGVSERQSLRSKDQLLGHAHIPPSL